MKCTIRIVDSELSKYRKPMYKAVIRCVYGRTVKVIGSYESVEAARSQAKKWIKSNGCDLVEI